MKLTVSKPDDQQLPLATPKPGAPQMTTKPLTALAETPNETSVKIKELYRVLDWDESNKDLNANGALFFETSLPTGVAEEDGYWYWIMQTLLGMNATIAANLASIASPIPPMVYSASSPNSTKNETLESLRKQRDDTRQINQSAHRKEFDRTGADAVSFGIAKAFRSDGFVLRPVAGGFEVELTEGPKYPSSLEDFFATVKANYLTSPGIRYPDQSGAADIDETLERMKKNGKEFSSSSAIEEYARDHLAKIEQFFGIKIAKRSDLTKAHSKRVPCSWSVESLFLEKDKTATQGVFKSGLSKSQIKKLGDYCELRVTLHPVEAYLRASYQFNVKSPDGEHSEFKDRDLEAVSALFGLKISVMPVIKMVTPLAEYLSQSSPPNVSALWTWIGLWLNAWFYTQKGRVIDNVVPISRSSEVTKHKAELGVYVQNTRSNEEGFNVDADGVFQYDPPTMFDSTLATRYESVMAEAIDLSQRLNEPVRLSRVTLDTDLVLARGTDDPETVELRKASEALKEKLAEILSLQRAPLAVNWDLNLSLSLGDHGIQEKSLEGNCFPRDSAIGSQFLRPVSETALRFVRGCYYDGDKIASASDISSVWSLGQLDVKTYAVRLASYLFVTGHIKNVSHYLQEAAKSLGKDKLTPADREYHLLDALQPSEDNVGEDHGRYIDGEGLTFGIDVARKKYSEIVSDTRKAREARKMKELLEPSLSLTPVKVEHLGNARREAQDKHWWDLGYAHSEFDAFFNAVFSILELLESDSRHWKEEFLAANKGVDSAQDSLDEFQIVNYDRASFGEEALTTSLELAGIMGSLVYGKALSLLCKDVLANIKKSDVFSSESKASQYVTGKSSFLPSYQEMSSGALPFLYFWSLLPDAQKYVDAHNQAIEQRKGAAELPPLATGKDFRLFPHQEDDMKLAASFPDIQVGDIAPGGGKTVLTFLKAVNFLVNKNVKRIGIICPNALLVNYANDIQLVGGHNWNFIPITTDTFNRWGEIELGRMIRNAPKNTIIGIGMDWLSRANRSVVQIGTVQRDIFQSVEFLRQFDFEAFLIDEGHKLRKYSQRNKCVASLVQDPRVKYKVHVTGTLVVDDLTDVIPQSRLFDPMIYGSLDEFRDEYFANGVWSSDSIRKMRKTLSQETAFRRFTKKDWAFCLPMPNETIIPVTMPDTMRSVYDAILEETLAKIEEDAKVNPALQKLLDSLTDGSDSDEDDEDMSGLLTPYLARLEQFLMDPEGDLLGKKLTGLVSPKIEAAIERLSDHFKTSKNKVIIACRYKRSAAAMLRHLPPELQKMAVYYDAGHKDAKFRFENDPSVRIICAVEQSIIEGFNLQFCDRIIRLESVWSPGEADQMNSRIFRPDVQNKFGRESIELDWIFCDLSMETPKVARLVAKTLAKAAFDEYGNHLYDDLGQLPKIRMTLKTFRSLNSANDYAEYFKEYGQFVRIRNTEFKQALTEAKARSAKDGRDSVFVNVKSAPLPADFQLVRTPVFPGQQLPDPLNHGYELIVNYINDEERSKHFQADPEILVGLPVRTDTGFGTITKVKYQSEVDDETGDVTVHLKSVTIEYADFKNLDTGEQYVETMSGAGSRLNMVYVAKTVPEKDLPLYTEPHEWETMPVDVRAWADGQLAQMGKASKAKKAKVVEVAPLTIEPKEDVQKDWSVNLHIATINGVPAVYVNAVDPDVKMIDWVKGVQRIEEIVSSHALTLADFQATLTFLTKKFLLNPRNVTYLQQFAALFKLGKNKRFDASLIGTQQDLRHFYRETHQAQALGSLSVFPLVEDGQFYFIIDRKTNQSSSTLPGKPIPGASTHSTWTKSGPFELYLFNARTKKTEIRAFIKSLVDDGFTIANEDQLKEQYAGLNW